MLNGRSRRQDVRLREMQGGFVFCFLIFHASDALSTRFHKKEEQNKRREPHAESELPFLGSDVSERLVGVHAGEDVVHSEDDGASANREMEPLPWQPEQCIVMWSNDGIQRLQNTQSHRCQPHLDGLFRAHSMQRLFGACRCLKLFGVSNWIVAITNPAMAVMSPVTCRALWSWNQSGSLSLSVRATRMPRGINMPQEIVINKACASMYRSLLSSDASTDAKPVWRLIVTAARLENP